MKRSRQHWQAFKDGVIAFGLALVVHLAVVVVMIVGTWSWEPFRAPPVPVRVTLVDQGPVVQTRPAVDEALAQAERRRQAAAEQRQREEAAERQRQEEEAQRREEEAQRQAELEEQRRQAAIEQQREEDELARRQAAEEQRRALEEERREREQARARELEEIRRQREAAQREREEQQRRLDELAEQRQREADEIAAEQEAERLRLADERAAAEARRATLREEYIGTIRELVRRSWIRPPNTSPGVRCDVRVIQIPEGEIIDAGIVSPCNADEATRRSIIAAVNRVGRLPYRGYENVFDREIFFTFVYDG